MVEEKKIKVFHVITMLELGGAQQNTLFTVGNLDKTAFDATLVSGTGGMLDAVTGERKLKTIFVPGLVRPVNPWKDLAAIFRLYSLFKREKPDIVHTHSSKAGIIGRIAARLAGVKGIIHSFHGFGFHDYQSLPVRLLYQGLEKFCALFSDRLIFVSWSNLETAKKLGIGNPAKYRVVRSGIDLGLYPAKIVDAASKRKELGLPPEGPVITSVANMKLQKNPEDFIIMAASVVEKVPTACFLFIGDGELRPKVEALLQSKGLAGRCVLPGWRRDINAILPISRIFALTSLWEGLPRSLVEALRCGIPSVCYAADGVTDILKDGENGFVIKRKDVAAMTEKIVSLLTDEQLWNRCADGAKAADLKEFDIREMVKTQEKLYSELIQIKDYHALHTSRRVRQAVWRKNTN